MTSALAGLFSWTVSIIKCWQNKEDKGKGNLNQERKKSCDASVQTSRRLKVTFHLCILSSSRARVTSQEKDTQKENTCKGDENSYVFPSPTFSWTNSDNHPPGIKDIVTTGVIRKKSLLHFKCLSIIQTLLFTSCRRYRRLTRVFTACSRSNNVAVHPRLRQPSGRLEGKQEA